MSHLDSKRKRKTASIDLNRLNKALIARAVSVICLSPRVWGPYGTFACAFLSNLVRLSKRYHVKYLVLSLFLTPKHAYGSLPDPAHSCTFLHRWHQVGVGTWLHLLEMLYRVWIPRILTPMLPQN